MKTEFRVRGETKEEAQVVEFWLEKDGDMVVLRVRQTNSDYEGYVLALDSRGMYRCKHLDVRFGIPVSRDCGQIQEHIRGGLWER